MRHRRRPASGGARHKFHQGKPVIDAETGEPDYEHVYSDVLLVFRLKALRREMYRERYEVKKSDAELNRENEELLAAVTRVRGPERRPRVQDESRR